MSEITIEYIGTQERWPELALTGKQSVWSPGQIESRPAAEASALLASGLFSSPPVPVVAVRSPGGGIELSAGSKPINIEPTFPQAYIPARIEVNVGGDAILNSINGRLVRGATSRALSYSDDNGATWVPVGQAPAPLATSASGLYGMPDGEVLFVSGVTVWRSTGWPSTGTTWTQVLAAGLYGSNQATFTLGWSVKIHENLVMLSEYGTPKPNAHRVYLSTDGGQTFSVVFDQRDFYTVTGASDAHMHGCAIDPWHAEAPRLWVMSADSVFIGIWWSDNWGATWTRVPASNYDGIVIDYDNAKPPNNYTTIHATPWGLALGADGAPNGTAVIRRDESYAASPVVRIACTFNDGVLGITHVARATVSIGQWVYCLHPQATTMSGVVPPRITATDTIAGIGYVIHEFPREMTGLSGLMLHDGDLWVRNNASGAFRMLRLPLRVAANIPAQAGAGTAWKVAPGRAVATSTALAIHPTAECQDDRTIAVGPGAKASFRGQIIIGSHITIEGESAIGVVPIEGGPVTASINGARTVAIGYRPTMSGGNRNVLIGDSNNCAGQYTVQLGSQTNSASGNETVLIGRLTAVSNSEGCAVGTRAVVSGQRGTAIGPRTTASHTNAVALGSYSETARAQSVACGDRDIELQGVGRGIITRSPDGTLYKISVANGGTLTVTPV